MSRTLDVYRALSGSQVVFFTSDETEPSGISNKTLVSSLQVPNVSTGITTTPVEAWTLDGETGLTGSVDGTLFGLSGGTKVFGPGPLVNTESIFFNGSTRFATSNTASLVLTGSVTLSVFFFPTALATAATYPVSFATSAETSDGNSLYTFRVTTNNQWNVFLETGAGSDIIPGPSNIYSLQPGQWHHIVYARDENTTNFMYHNGELIHSGTEGGPDGGSAAFLNIGGFPSDGTTRITGYLFALKVFDRALTNDEIRQETRRILGNRF